MAMNRAAQTALPLLHTHSVRAKRILGLKNINGEKASRLVRTVHARSWGVGAL